MVWPSKLRYSELKLIRIKAFFCTVEVSKITDYLKNFFVNYDKNVVSKKKSSYNILSEVSGITLYQLNNF